jgi:hypothetical protein
VINMPKDFKNLQIPVPDLTEVGPLLKGLATIVIYEIKDMIEREEQPDGSPQKQNSPGYQIRKAAVKGYTTPLKGISAESPYLARASSQAPFKKELQGDDTIVIYLNSKRSEAGVRLQEKGYWFMGITDRALKMIPIRVDRFFKDMLKKMARKYAS